MNQSDKVALSESIKDLRNANRAMVAANEGFRKHYQVMHQDMMDYFDAWSIHAQAVYLFLKAFEHDLNSRP